MKRCTKCDVTADWNTADCPVCLGQLEDVAPTVPFRAGDIVHHNPSGEDWLIAGDEENGKVQPCDWPNTMAEAEDCRLMEAATDEDRLKMLNAWAEKGKGYEHERDSRTHTARRQLQALTVKQVKEEEPTPETDEAAMHHGLGGTVSADFARYLERGRNALAKRFTKLDKPRYSGEPMLDEVLGTPNPEFNAWVESLPPTYWARYDLSAARIGWEAAMKTRPNNL